MATVALSTFYSRVAPHVQGCPDPIIEEAVRDACIELADQSLLWQELLDTPVVTAGESDVELEVPANSAITRIMHVWWGGHRLVPSTPDEQSVPDVYTERIGTYRARRATPGQYLVMGPTLLAVHPVSSKTEAAKLVVVAALKPTRTTTVVPDVFYNDHAETIAAGAIARLTAVPGTAFTNPEVALFRAQQFGSAIAAERININRGSGRASLTVRQNPLA